MSKATQLKHSSDQHSSKRQINSSIEIPSDISQQFLKIQQSLNELFSNLMKQFNTQIQAKQSELQHKWDDLAEQFQSNSSMMLVPVVEWQSSQSSSQKTKKQRKEHSFIEQHSLDSQSHIKKIERSKSVNFKSKAVRKHIQLKRNKSFNDQAEKEQ